MTITLNKCQCSPGVKVDGGCAYCNPIDYALKLEAETEATIEELEDRCASIESEKEDAEYDHDRAMDTQYERYDDLVELIRNMLEKYDDIEVPECYGKSGFIEAIDELKEVVK